MTRAVEGRRPDAPPPRPTSGGGSDEDQTGGWLSSAGSKIRDGTAELPWTMIKIGALAFLVWLIAGEYWGNLIRCAIFDSSGCAPRLEVAVTKSRVNLDWLRGGVENRRYHAVVDRIPEKTSGSSLYKYDIVVENVGASNLREFTIDPTFLPDHSQEGIFLSFALNDDKTKPPVGPEGIAVSEAAVVLDPGWLANESVKVSVVGMLPDATARSTEADLELRLTCAECQVKYRRLRFP